MDTLSLTKEARIYNGEKTISLTLLHSGYYKKHDKKVLCFHTNCEIICSSSVENIIGSLIGIALNL